ELFLLQKSVCIPEMQLCSSWLELDRRLVILPRFIPAALLLQEHSQVQMSFWKTWSQPERAPEMTFGLRRLFFFHEHQRVAINQLRIIRTELQHLLQTFFPFALPARAE